VIKFYSLKARHTLHALHSLTAHATPPLSVFAFLWWDGGMVLVTILLQLHCMV